jgi:imidazolonepropionase-like amidohydrolase
MDVAMRELITATTNAAALLGMEGSLGAVKAGCYADLVGVEGDPLAGIDALIHGVRRVMKDGVVVVDATRAAGRD